MGNHTASFARRLEFRRHVQEARSRRSATITLSTADYDYDPTYYHDVDHFTSCASQLEASAIDQWQNEGGK